MLNKIASNPELSRGRLFNEQSDKHRNCFQRDRDRVIHSAAFRRLAYKTQVFVNHEGDHYRTRLTHSLEVAQIARTISNNLGLCTDLVETLALSHDIGHPPFGHAGEDALNQMMVDYGGFDHNAQTIRILTNLERNYSSFDGLNLTWESLEGIAKHNGPLIGKYGDKNKKIHSIITSYNNKHDLCLDKFPSLEAQIASVSDDIAYNNHDIEDGCRAGLIKIEDFLDIKLIRDVLAEVQKNYGPLPDQKLVFAITRKIINLMVEDVLKATTQKISDLNIKSSEDIRNCDQMIGNFSEEFLIFNQQIKQILQAKVYNHYKINKMTNKAKRIVKELFKIFMNDPRCLPTEWQILIPTKVEEAFKANVICDFIAGMTDRYVIKEYRTFFDISQD